jgi:hypothetical protein
MYLSLYWNLNWDLWAWWEPKTKGFTIGKLSIAWEHRLQVSELLVLVPVPDAAEVESAPGLVVMAGEAGQVRQAHFLAQPAEVNGHTLSF